MKKGFTLIELLAVIVILAIIALIATPIVLNIIDESKKNFTLRSADFYLDAVEFSVAQASLKNQKVDAGTYNILENGNICLGYDTNNICKDELAIEVKGKVPESGTITITDGKITGLNIEIEGKEIYKTSKGELVYVKLLDEVCELKSGTPKTAGAKYECKVDPNKEPYTFYVLTTPSSTDASINLIMDQNINSDGTPAGTINVTQSTNPTKYNLMAWVSKADYNADTNYGTYVDNNKGPLTAMNFLQEATNTWTNTNEMMINAYTDQTGKRYNMQSFNTYARMPIYLSDTTKTEVTIKINAPYLYDNLGLVGDLDSYGYWTLSCNSDQSDRAWFVFNGGDVMERNVELDNSHGVRPVITLKM